MREHAMQECIAIAGCTGMTMDFADALLRSEVRIAHLITITPEQAQRNKVFNYRDLRGWARERRIPVLLPRKYAMKDQEDIDAVNELRLDILFVIGWQRLIPNPVLARLRIGAFGMHGSPDGLPRGRGRSPLNWSLITGRTSFRTYLFRYDAGVDSGDYVDFVEFDINDHDTCETLHFKNCCAMIHLVRTYLPALLRGEVRYRRQQGEPSYYPKRESEDGGIDWTRSVQHVHNFVRAQTRPFPGAFTLAGKRKIFIWHGQPFDSHLPLSGDPGQIVAVTYNALFVVQTGQDTYLVTDYEAADGADFVPEVGTMFRSIPYDETLRRTVARYPESVLDHQREIRLKTSGEE
jgi:methionyl-tRNA formyltransferase